MRLYQSESSPGEIPVLRRMEKMNDEEALKATAELVAKIMLECKKYADRDGLDFLFVVQTTAKAMLKIIN